MSSFQDLDKLIHINPEAEAQSVKNYKTDREPVLRRLRETPLGYFLRVIMNEFNPNLEKTTNSALSVVSINLCFLLVCPFKTFLCKRNKAKCFRVTR